MRVAHTMEKADEAKEENCVGQPNNKIQYKLPKYVDVLDFLVLCI